MNRVKSAALAVSFLGAMGIVAAGCLDRPVTSSPPSTESVFTTSVSNKAVDKVDMLFMIDNSVSMGDKQSLLALAVPIMIQRLVTPNCIDATTGMPDGTQSTDTGSCTNANSKPEFPPVHDMHIGIVSSSLGSRGGNVCPDTMTNPVNTSLNAHNNDNGELLNRTGVVGDPTVENTISDTGSLNFLSYFPNVAANTGKPTPPTPAVGSPASLVTDFTSLIAGVHEHGCGFEAQNEAWYRFLVQPDPFATITVGSSGQASLSGIDNTILQQRANFLRPDSLVAVVVVTDENEEAADPLAIRGQGYAFDDQPFPGSQSGGGGPEGTVQCQALDPNNPSTTGPNDPNCSSCAFMSTSSPNFATECPQDGTAGSKGYLDPANDAINLRFWHQKERFGLYAGYPVSRYIRGLQKQTVPSVGLAFKGDTDHEHDSNGNYVGDQDAKANCVNPLFAENLPTSSSSDLCHLTPGPRGPGLVYYAAIAGVPHQLLQTTPGENDQYGSCPSTAVCANGTCQCPQKTTLSDADWLLITGKNPDGYDPSTGTVTSFGYDYSGADYHMVESDVPRTTNTGNWGTSPGTMSDVSKCPPPATGTIPSATCDPYNGSEFNTIKSDLEFACIFPLIDATGSTITPFNKDCTQSEYEDACDCANGTNGGTAALDMGTQLCSPTTTTTQVNAKAYPSVREMEIAHAMSNQVINGAPSDQGIVSSLCPINLDVGQSTTAALNDPLFGYNPAVNAIVDRLKQSLNDTCVPQQLEPSANGDVECLVLVSLPGQGSCNNPGSACVAAQGLYGPNQVPANLPAGAPPLLSQDVLDNFCTAQESAYTGSPDGGDDPANHPVCALAQISYANDIGHDQNLCTSSPTAGWCYIQGAAATKLGCPDPYTITFTSGAPPNGATTTLQCLESAINVVDAGVSGGDGGGGSSGGGGGG